MKAPANPRAIPLNEKLRAFFHDEPQNIAALSAQRHPDAHSRVRASTPEKASTP